MNPARTSLEMRRSGCLAALLLSLAGCGTDQREIMSIATLRSGTVPCARGEDGHRSDHRDLIWRSDDPKHGCDITVTYRGTEDCPAHLEYVTPHESAWIGGQYSATNYGGTNMITFPEFRPKKTKPAKAGGATVTLQDVTDIWLVCGELEHPHSGECSYTINEIDCSRTAEQVYTTTTNAPALLTANVACGTENQVVWSAPTVSNKTASCTVTLQFKSSGDCHASLWSYDRLGNKKGLQTTGKKPLFVTFHDISQLKLSCWAMGSSNGECSVEIVQTDCAK